MFTGMFAFKDQYGHTFLNNTRIGGFRTAEQAVRAVLKKSPLQSGEIRRGSRLISLVDKGKVISL